MNSKLSMMCVYGRILRPYALEELINSGTNKHGLIF